MARGRAAAAALARHRRLLMALQIGGLLILAAFLVYALHGSWHRAAPRLRDADLGDVAIAVVLVAVYYLAFVVGWLWILRGFGIRLHYTDALRAEMVSMLAKYVPGGVWTPAARVVAARRAGVDDTSLVLGSIALEAGLSAIAGVAVFVIGLPAVGHVSPTTIALLIGFAVLIAVLAHPRVFPRAASALFRTLGGSEVPALSYRRTAALLLYYCGTWLIGGSALYFLLRALGDAPANAIPFLGGASAVGAIVAVLVVFAPSGLGVREGATYALLRIVAGPGPALGAVLLNRLIITAVEAALFFGASFLPRRRVQPPDEPER